MNIPVVTVSTKYQICIPKQVREPMHLKAGHQLMVILKGETIHLVPVPTYKDLKGALKGANTENFRDKTDRV